MTERYRGKWLVLEEDGMRHLLPESDIKPHSTDTVGEEREVAGASCPCKPKTIWTDAFIVIHNSFQDKEFLEELLELEKGV